MSENLQYLAVAGGSLFTERLESGTIMGVCSMMEVSCKFRAAFLQMVLES